MTRRVIMAGQLVKGDRITAWIDPDGKRTGLARPRRVVSVAPEFADALCVTSTTLTGRSLARRPTDPAERVEIEVTE